MFNILIELFNRAVLLQHCYRNSIRLVKNVEGSNISYFGSAKYE